MADTYWIETLGCPKNQVDSDKLDLSLETDGWSRATDPSRADLIVVNTCAFIDSARAESIDTILDLSERRAESARVVVTGCMAERYGQELASALPDIDSVAPFGVPLAPDGSSRRSIPVSAADPLPSFDLLNLPRSAADRPWAYVKIAEGCDRACGFCAIPSFRGPQRSRSVDAILEEVDALAVSEVVLVAQDLASFGRDQGVGERRIIELVERVSERVPWTRLLYLYPSDLDDGLIDLICRSAVPYVDLSLQHVSRPLLRRMRRWGDGDRFAARIADIRERRPDAALRSNFIVGYPGETEDDHDALMDFVAAVGLDWCGFFAYSAEAGTYAADLDGEVPPALVSDRLSELSELQDAITARRRDDLIGSTQTVLVDSPGVGRSFREAPEIDGIVHLPRELPPGSFVSVEIVAAVGPDLVVAGAETEAGLVP